MSTHEQRNEWRIIISRDEEVDYPWMRSVVSALLDDVARLECEHAMYERSMEMNYKHQRERAETVERERDEAMRHLRAVLNWSDKIWTTAEHRQKLDEARAFLAEHDAKETR